MDYLTDELTDKKKPPHKPEKPSKPPHKPESAHIKDYDKNQYDKRGSKVKNILKSTWNVLDKTLDKLEQIVNITQAIDSMFNLGIFENTDEIANKIAEKLKEQVKNDPGKEINENIEDKLKKELTAKVKELVLKNFKDDPEIVNNEEMVEYLTFLTTDKLWELKEKEPSEDLILKTINEVFDDPNNWKESFFNEITEINSIDLQNESSTSGYKPNSSQM
ncbi:hypothetical protein [Spiroplasma endosymbiont of Dactylopius coccus]